MPNQNNLVALQAVARALGPLRERVVFVGGTTAGLYTTIPSAPESWPTEDVDCICLPGCVRPKTLAKPRALLGEYSSTGDSVLAARSPPTSARAMSVLVARKQPNPS